MRCKAIRNRTLLFMALLVLSPSLATIKGATIDKRLRSAVVKIYATYQRPDYTMPWQTHPPASGTGTGFMIANKRILTNAHVVSDARFIEVQKEDAPQRYRARVKFVAHDCDLAILEVTNTAFYEGTHPLAMAKKLPDLNDEVTVLGYPMGGDRQSVTRGVVSRIDFSRYAHSGIDHHLVLQVDAAINPGNSGGPVLFGKRVVGLAFQGLAWAENIGYAIPLPVLNHFLDDIADGEYHGYPELGISFLSARNPALRKHLNIPVSKGGVAVTMVDPYGAAAGFVKNGDVVLTVDGHTVGNDGTIAFNGTRVLFAELTERRQWGETINMEVWHNNERLSVDVPLINHHDPFLFRNTYDKRPRYLVRGGLVFAPLTHRYLQQVEGSSSSNVRQLIYFATHAKIDGFHKDFDEFVVLIRRLPHPVNAYSGGFMNGVLTHLNGKRIRRLEDVRTAWQSSDNGFINLEFAGMKENLILRKNLSDTSHKAILDAYGIPADAYLGEVQP
ncbi:MAG: trypsin-like peptidase domain-containing protein [Kiritimatiellae bacterium]|nr:trypsin-like peptidase domain-containing protein [Kiritimatiellia bacterium]